MKPISRSALRRPLALSLAALLLLGTAAPALAAAEIAPTCDETYYATLDPYGTFLEGSVVKTWSTYGNGKLVDYGVYDQVVNLTDSRTPAEADGKVTFDLTGDVPDKFYFEGKTAQPYQDFPWKLSLSYALNGVPTPAEDLAGKTGVVEITLNALPNPAASEYSRNNLTLMAASMFNGDDILSLEAPGAQVQLIGNLYCVIYAVLPGEEQHFTIRVGSEDFSYSGMVFLAVPATLDQLSQVADLKEAKEEIEDSYDAINASLDVILNSLDGMSGSLLSTANGLDRLNAARGTVSGGKGEVYEKTDAALNSLNGLADSLGSLDGYTDTLSQAVTDVNGTLNDLNAAAQDLKPELENTRKTIAALQKDAEDLRELLTDVEGYNKKATSIASSLASLLEDLEGNTEDLHLRMILLESALKNTKGITPLTTSDLLGFLSKEEAEQMKTVLNYRSQYEKYLAENKLTESDLSFENFIIAAAYKQYCEAYVKGYVETYVTTFVQQYVAANGVEPPQEALDQAKDAGMKEAQGKLPTQEDFPQTKEGQAAAAKAKAASDAYGQLAAQMPMVDTINGKIKEINSQITGLTKPTAELVDSLADLVEDMGDNGMTGDLAELAKLCRDLLKTMKEHEGEGAALVDDLNAMGDLAVRVTQTADTALGHIDSLNDILNTYEPTLQNALIDIQTLSTSAQTTLRDAAGALGSIEGLLRDSGPGLDEGTRQSLSGLSASLRKATTGLDQTDTIRASKDTITSLIEDQWNTHAGEENNLLLMDATAAPESLTDSRNQGVTSVQYVMRSQEIKAADPPEEAAKASQQPPKTTLWDRIKTMLRDIWTTITGIF